MSQILIEIEGGSDFRNHPLISSAHGRGENRNEFERFIRDFVRDLNPEGAVEATFAARSAGLAWRLNRAQRLETVVLSKRGSSSSGCLIDNGLESRYGRDNIEMISRWEQNLERSLLKMLGALESLQRRRGKLQRTESADEFSTEMEKAMAKEIKQDAKAVVVTA